MLRRGSGRPHDLSVARNYASPDRKAYVGIRKSHHSAHKMDFHIVMATKARKPFFRDERIADFVLCFILEICQKEGYIPLALSVQPDHVHMFLGLEPKHSISEVVKRIKAVVAQELSKRERLEGGIWAHGYYVESLGFKNPGQIKAYIDRQSEHHAPEGLEDLSETPE